MTAAIVAGVVGGSVRDPADAHRKQQKVVAELVHSNDDNPALPMTRAGFSL
jgi:hypothetical protein